MTSHRFAAVIFAITCGVLVPGLGAQHAFRPAAERRPDGIVDLRTEEGVALVRGRWRYRNAEIVPVEFRSAGPDQKPSGAPNRTFDVSPKAGASAFDDSGWTIVAPTDLETRRSGGRLSFGWYRINVTIPDRVGALDTRGATVVFEIVVDDYAEIWVDGQLPRVLGQTGGPLVKGFNAPNRVVLTRDARPGQTVQLAVFGANGPLSDPPPNYVWIRSATLELFAPGSHESGRVAAAITRRDPGLDHIVPPGTTIEKLAEGFQFTEGPVWVPDGYLLFSDPNANIIYRWSDEDGLSVFRTKSGYTGMDVGEYGQPGSNGLALDPDGRLTINEHGNRRVTRLEKNGALSVLTDRFEGRRLNSPNDLVYKSDGSLYFTDPPFGLPRFSEDPRKELPFSGIYRWADGRVQLLARDLSGPNGIAFSPDESFLYVGNWDDHQKVVMRYPVQRDGTLGEGRVFFDLTAEPGEDAIDGIKVDAEGNVYVSGPGGLWVFAPDGVALGTIAGPEHPHNMAWGDADGRTLYLTAQTGLYRMRVGVPGAGRSRSAAE